MIYLKKPLKMDFFSFINPRCIKLTARYLKNTMLMKKENDANLTVFVALAFRHEAHPEAGVPY